MRKQVELLAPAGNYEAFLGAINAGADAVYLGGDRFGARAYADNFDTQQILCALHVAHFYGKRIYLTVNTLLKEPELDTVCDYLSPFAEAGLDGVIVQDFGVLSRIRDRFPELPLHASTQMAVTGRRAAALLKQAGISRIVPARELSLEETKEIKDTGMDVECFIHGAMCYCYSGQCLFSSILGGRSGNRGRCAQPCRLPYQVFDGKKQLLGNAYPLSLKDMCTVEYLPALLEAGIDSFKIEGRMKRPEYAAGVTAVYRKYIDLYYKEGASGFRVDVADMEKLRSLYIRSEIQTGYYTRHNGKEMVSLKNPGYSGSDESILSQIRERYVREPDQMPVRMQARVKTGEPLRLRLMAASEKETYPVIETQGAEVQTAQKAPLTEEDVRKRLCKTGGSLLRVEECTVVMEGEGFVPVRALNELRRQAVEAFEKAVIESRGTRIWKKKTAEGVEKASENRKRIVRLSQSANIDCLVTTLEQLQAVYGWGGCRRIYIESDLFLTEYEKVLCVLKTTAADDRPEYYLALPYILRTRDDAYLGELERVLEKTQIPFGGFLVRNLEGAAYGILAEQKRRSAFLKYSLVPDAGLYCFNGEAARFLAVFAKEVTLPFELNAKEAANLVRAVRGEGMGTNLIVYGRIPMMITANCLQKTADSCKAGEGERRRIFLKDRTGASFPVAVNCKHCYNVIYNSVPYSLHGAGTERERIDADALRYDFVTESGPQCRQILEGNFPFAQYTAGHSKRGVQ